MSSSVKQLAGDAQSNVDLRQFERYERLDAIDRHSAETLNTFCRVNSRLGATATRLANISTWQSFVTSIPLAVVDVLTLYGCLWIASFLINRIPGFGEIPSEHMLISLVVLPIANLAGLYPGFGMGPIVEFRQLTRALFASVLLFAGIGWFCFTQHWLLYSLVAMVAFPMAIPAVGTSRFIARHLAKHFRFWGAPILIVAEPVRALQLYRRIEATKEHGYRPVGVLLDSAMYWEGRPFLEAHKVPVFELPRANAVALRHRAAWVLVSACANRSVTPAHDPSLAAIPNRIQLSSNELDLGLWDQVFCVGATSGIRVGSACPSYFQLAMKRLIDIVLTAGALIAGLPVLSVIYMLVRLSSRGPVFYGQGRIGYGGKEFKAWKFRTMQQNADQVLADYLRNNPSAQAEWEEKHKLMDDPRVTQIGKFLRATSLDEIPQLWNVLRGQMSLVGPRPIIDSPTYDGAYIRQYPDEFEAYKSVRPGLTGLWQVRCRNSGVYDLRIYWDMYYIRNWSVWLDLYLIMRTIKTVLLREGAS